MKAKPKFKVKQRVFSRLHNRIVTIDLVVWNDEKERWEYRFKRYAMLWLEDYVRPLTKREKG